MDVNECDEQEELCQNGGQCLNEPGSYECLCYDGFEGLNCEEELTYCPTNICLNDGICMGNGLNFTCVCPVGFRYVFI